jgi:hypothetical protein
MDKEKKRFVIGDGKGDIRVYNYLNGVMMKELHSHQSEVTSIVISQKEGVIVTAAINDKTIFIHSDKNFYSTVPPKSLKE